MMRNPLTALLLATAFAVCGISLANAASVKILHRFNGSDGLDPQAALTLGPHGKLYGTTLAGGQFDHGTIFRFDPTTGKFKTLHHFSDQEGSDSLGQLLLASDGYFYGTTRYGGTDNFNCVAGCGMIYRILPSGADFSVQHFMTVQEGSTLQGGLIEGPDGRLYGTATLGGAFDCADSSARCGTVYAFSRDTKEVAVLHTFNFSDGRWPYGRVVLASNGYLYGTTSSGAAGEAGTVYRIKPDGSGFDTLVQFANASAGCQPKAGLIEASNGKLYGTAEDCGSAVYSVTPNGAITAIHIFNGDDFVGDGSEPTAEVLQAPDGKLYSTARIGGLPVDDPDRSGTVYRFKLNGDKFRVLHTFLQSPDGSTPTTGLTTGPDGNLYGVTPAGGNEPWPGKGTVYRLKLVK